MNRSPHRRRRLRGLAAVAACSIATVAIAQAPAQYRWVDRNGTVTYGDAPPRDARRLERVAAAHPVDAADPTASLPFELRQAAQRYPVVLYAMPGSPACATARDFLRQRGIPFRELTVTTRTDLEEMKRRSAGDRVPVLGVGDRLLREFEPGAWGAALDAAGYPATSQLPASWAAPAPQALVEPAPAPPSPPAGGDATAQAEPKEAPTPAAQ